MHHEVVVSLTLTGLPAQGPVALRMSRSSPGRYALHEFAKNVYGFQAVDGAGHPLSVTRPDPYEWDVTGHDGTVKVTYTLFGDRGDGTYAQIDETHAHLNMPAVFMWARGLDARPIRVTFHLPDGSRWKVASQLFPTSDPLTFTAPGLQYFMDSPTELSDYMLRQWTVTSNGHTYPVRMAIHHLGTEAEADSFAAMAKKVVAQEIAVYGETPAYDVGSYTFIADYLPWASGDGMEHRNSTFISSQRLPGPGRARAPRDGVPRILPSMERRTDPSPRGWSRSIFSRANMSDALWFAEGFTNYYGPLLLERAGINGVQDYAHGLAGGLSFVINSPARRFFSAAEMSMQAPFVDAATSIDPTNRGNTFISYYTWGSVIGLGLDLTLRQKYGKTLDGLMRLMWTRYGKTEIPYTVDDIRQALADLTGDAAFARRLLRPLRPGTRGAGLRAAAGPGGLPAPARATRCRASSAWCGWTTATPGPRSPRNTEIGSPLYRAGLDRGDVIVSLDGQALRSDSVWQAVKSGPQTGRRHPGRVRFPRPAPHRFPHRRCDPRLEVVTYEEAGMPVTDAMRRFRDAWLGAK